MDIKVKRWGKRGKGSMLGELREERFRELVFIASKQRSKKATKQREERTVRAMERKRNARVIEVSLTRLERSRRAGLGHT